MIRIICVGKLKDQLKNVSEEYVKRIKGFTRIEIIEINEYKSSNIQESLKKEGERVLEKAGERFIVLDAKGKQLSSEEFSQILKQPNLTFVIGSHAGLNEDVKKKSNIQLSLSKMTIPHQITRVILLEQIYRGFSILNNQPYHK
ncbi:MAG: 23S rRNA (pseudouridine(1915)-N(3))-methyltransferase RlmH [Nanoarchaeota archaeon]|nr:23S rRNA (pseudouridine(1915)-N(3))-methyltransferase RlmH [Nanoarchaeota archaeon]